MRRALIAAALLCTASVAGAQQRADTAFAVTVARPAYPVGTGPRVALDEAHRNFHTLDGRYAPFGKLLRADGYRVAPNTKHLDRGVLRGFDVLVVANASGGATPETADRPAFTTDEIAAVRKWVNDGGSLLLVADHAPFGGAAESLALAFNVGMTKGFAIDTAASAHALDNPSFLRYTRENHGLGLHAITRGRDSTERVGTVVAFTGQSLTWPVGATPLLTMSPTAQERATRSPTDTLVSVGGRVQGIALPYGKGRVVVLGEAAMLSAQVVEQPGQPPFYMGINVPGTDDKQFALNVLHWLTRVLP
jgi:hypothetical protein